MPSTSAVGGRAPYPGSIGRRPSRSKVGHRPSVDACECIWLRIALEANLVYVRSEVPLPPDSVEARAEYRTLSIIVPDIEDYETLRGRGPSRDPVRATKS